MKIAAILDCTTLTLGRRLGDEALSQVRALSTSDEWDGVHDIIPRWHEYDMECELMTTLEDLELVMDLEDVEFQLEIEWLHKEIMILNGEEESNPPSGNFVLTHVEGKD